jgi:hypothetical protein
MLDFKPAEPVKAPLTGLSHLGFCVFFDLLFTPLFPPAGKQINEIGIRSLKLGRPLIIK